MHSADVNLAVVHAHRHAQTVLRRQESSHGALLVMPPLFVTRSPQTAGQTETQPKITTCNLDLASTFRWCGTHGGSRMWNSCGCIGGHGRLLYCTRTSIGVPLRRREGKTPFGKISKSSACADDFHHSIAHKYGVRILFSLPFPSFSAHQTGRKSSTTQPTDCSYLA